MAAVRRARITQRRHVHAASCPAEMGSESEVFTISSDEFRRRRVARLRRPIRQ
jgi:hypothetical protein